MRIVSALPLDSGKMDNVVAPTTKSGKVKNAFVLQITT